VSEPRFTFTLTQLEAIFSGGWRAAQDGRLTFDAAWTIMQNAPMFTPSEPPMTTDGEIHCQHCGVDIRHIGNEWLDRETHSTCERRPHRRHSPAPK
jgi:hypothetical protein